LLPVVFGALVFKLSVWCGAEGYVSGLITKAPNTTGSNHLYNTLELLTMGIMVSETCWASSKICNKNHLLHLVGILFPHINYDARSKSLQSYTIFFITVNAVPVSGDLSAHYQELKNCTDSIGYMPSLLARKLDIYPKLCVQFLSSWWWADKPPETCRALTVIKSIV
jgi:hypothetical protein